jgi:hypothetical protein
MLLQILPLAGQIRDTVATAASQGRGLEIEHLNIDIPELQPLHWILAYTGLAVHLLLKMAETPGGLLDGFTKKDVLITLASILAIPAILIVCTDTSLRELLPINYVTAFLAGYQTQSLLRTFGAIGGKYMDKASKQP